MTKKNVAFNIGRAYNFQSSWTIFLHDSFNINSPQATDCRSFYFNVQQTGCFAKKEFKLDLKF